MFHLEKLSKNWLILLNFLKFAAFSMIHKQVKKLRQSKLWRSCLIETCSLAGCGKCKPKKPPQACAEKAVDVIFVLDGSSSVGPKNGQLVQKLVQNKNILKILVAQTSIIFLLVHRRAKLYQRNRRQVQCKPRRR